MRRPKHRSGFVSLLGRPNAGKSTLLNALTGEKLAAVADKPQTTRTTVQGVLTLDHAQIVFMDTPGIHAPDSLINRRMMQSVSEALDQRDLLIFIADASLPFTPEDAAAFELVARAKSPTLLVLNKIDRVANKSTLLPLLENYRQLHNFAEYLTASALTGEGLDELKSAIIERIPEGPAYFPKDYITDQPERFLAAEIIREKILAATRQEVPHSVAVLVENWAEQERLTRVDAAIYVERPGQKVIVLGAKGSRLKEIGTQARIEMESIFGRKIFLSLFVKVRPKWRENEAFLKELDWRAMSGAPAIEEQ